MSIAKARRIVQVLFVIFFVILFIRARYPYETGLPSDIFLRFSPLIPLFDFIDQFRISLLFWPALLILLLTPFLGRFFCGWICPLGTTLDATSRVFKSKKDLRTQKDWKVFRPVKFGILVALIVLAVFSIPIWGIFDPLSIFNRALTAVLYPFGTLVFDKGLLQVSRVPFLEDAAYSVYDWFKVVIMPEEQAQVQQVFWITAFFGGILAL
ncbi:MAG: 4Fe-4S binding protein, partial [Candidatus Marinimicrobia bacterium]|nr:4Fe-4S binding protein [Candidatus Neomarinimicrobiota bacterium]